jgi:hypothetical protein
MASYATVAACAQQPALVLATQYLMPCATSAAHIANEALASGFLGVDYGILLFSALTGQNITQTQPAITWSLLLAFLNTRALPEQAHQRPQAVA